MAGIRDIGLGVINDREEAARQRREESQQYEVSVLLNKWAFMTSCVNRHSADNEQASSEVTRNGRRKTVRRD